MNPVKNKSSRASLSQRVLAIVSLGIFVILLLFSVSAYFNQLKSNEKLVLDKLVVLARSTAMQIEGERHQKLMEANLIRDAITQSEESPRYQKIHTLLRSVKQKHGLNTPIYTMIPEGDHFEFGVTSSKEPYFRHRWYGHGNVDTDNLLKGGTIPSYTDENGTWLTAYAPIRNAQGEAVAVVMADQKFGDFVASVRMEVLIEVLIALMVGVLVLYVLYRVLKPIADREEQARRKITRAYRTIKKKQKELADSYAVIESKNARIDHSMNYASRLQHALLPDEAQLRAALPNSFMFFRGKDKVSGDFPYVLRHRSGKTFVAAVDCTGHGVPGALLSIMGYFMLNDLIKAQGLSDPGEILTQLHRNVVQALNQENDTSTSQDGMDASLICIDPTEEVIRFAGAHRPVYHLSDHQLEEVKGDRLSIGGTQYSRLGKQVVFTSIALPYQKGDAYFLTSDGYQDQIGGEKGKKFQGKQLRELLSQVNGQPLEEFHQPLAENFDGWKGEYPQMDDVLVMGVRV